MFKFFFLFSLCLFCYYFFNFLRNFIYWIYLFLYILTWASPSQTLHALGAHQTFPLLVSSKYFLSSIVISSLIYKLFRKICEDHLCFYYWYLTVVRESSVGNQFSVVCWDMLHGLGQDQFLSYSMYVWKENGFSNCWVQIQIHTFITSNVIKCTAQFF